MQHSLFSRYYSQFLLVILCFTFFTRMYRLDVPEGYVFDEVYHAVTAKLIAKNDTRAYEWHNPPPEPNTAVDWLHPPVAKYFQAASIAVLGENSFAWRFSSVVFGVLVVLLAAQLARELFEDKEIALLAAFFTSLDGLVLVMSRIAMNDIHVTAFILISFLWYIRYIKSERKQSKLLIYSSIAAGVAAGTKWSGVFPLVVIAITESVFYIKRLRKNNLYATLQKVPLLFVAGMCIPAALYVASYGHMFLLGKDFAHLIEMHKNTWWYQTNLTAEHPAQSTPLQWFTNSRPVWISVDYETQGSIGNIYAVGNPFLSAWIALSAIFSLLFLLQTVIKKNPKAIQQNYWLAFAMLMYLSVWLFWQLSPRIMFFYHYLPAIPLGSILLAYWTAKLLKHKHRWIAAGIISSSVVGFIVWYPHWTLLPVPISFAEDVYFFFDFWRQL